MPSIADEWRAARKPTHYPETFQGQPIRVECHDYVLHRIMVHGVCPKCHGLDWVLTEAGREAFRLFKEWEAAKPLFQELLDAEPK